MAAKIKTRVLIRAFLATWHPGDYAVCALTAPIDLLVVMDASHVIWR